MNKIDDQIRKALREDDAALFDDAGTEQSLYREAMGLFRGQWWWIGVMSAFFMLVAMAFAIYSAIRFFNAVDTYAMLFWAMIFMICMIGGTTIKIWGWMRMNRNAVIREVKRVELQVATLAQQMTGTDITPPQSNRPSQSTG